MGRSTLTERIYSSSAPFNSLRTLLGPPGFLRTTAFAFTMAWPHPFTKSDANTRTAWGYTFQITDHHLTPEQAHPLKYSYDTLGEEALDVLNTICPPTAPALPRKSGGPNEKARNQKGADEAGRAPVRDLYALLRDNAETDQKLGELWRQVSFVPDWVDWEQIARGQEVFYRYGGASLTGLAYQSLLGGMVSSFPCWKAPSKLGTFVDDC